MDFLPVDDITQPVGTEHTIDKAVGLTIGKTDLNAIHKTIGTKAALLLVFMTNTSIVLPQVVISQAKWIPRNTHSLVTVR
jgi:hypothetical protein